MSIATPVLPAVNDYPSTTYHSAELETAHKLFLQELASNEGWEDQGEREGVQLYKKPDPENPYAVPTVKGECLVQDCTSDAFLAVIQLPGMRKRWDPRFEQGHILARYNRHEYAFYSEMKGMGWIVYPRDIVGIQKNMRSSDFNQEILVVQTSVEELELAPEQSGKTRATLFVSGWQLKPQGKNLLVTYVVKVGLNGSMPSAMVNMIATETPLCTGRARDVYYSLGHAPYIKAATPETPIVFQRELFSAPALVPTESDPLEFTVTFLPILNESFEIVYDAEKMYKGGATAEAGEGIKVTVEEGVVKVVCERGGEVAQVIVGPKA